MFSYFDNILDKGNHAIRALLGVLDYQVKILGTDVTVERVSEQDIQRQAFGAMFQTDNDIDVDKSYFTSRYIINRHTLSEHFTKRGQPISIFDRTQSLRIGDTISFKHGSYDYRFKVERMNSYGLEPYILYKFDLVGIPERSN